MLKIRLARIGKKNQPLYRIVLAEHARPVKNKFVEILGVYDPRGKQGEPKLNKERITYWIGQGAQVSPRVANILKQAGVVKGDEKAVKQALDELAQKKAAMRKPKKEAEKSEEGDKGDAKSADEKSEPTEDKKEAKGDEQKPAENKPAEDKAETKPEPKEEKSATKKDDKSTKEDKKEESK